MIQQDLPFVSKSRISFPVNSSVLTDPTGKVATFLNDFASSAQEQGFRKEQVGETETSPLLAFTRHTPGPRPRLYISAGIHGDEPAPPVALFELIREGFFDHRANWFLCPVINPNGLQLGQRENQQGHDLNRDFLARRTPEIRSLTTWLNRQPPFDLCLCLHEDWEAEGIYIYEVNRRDTPGCAAEILQSAQAALPVDSATTIDERPIDEPGIIRPISDPLLRENWPETIYLNSHHTSLGYTFETPSGKSLESRVNALKLAVSAAVNSAIRDFGQTEPCPSSTEP